MNHAAKKTRDPSQAPSRTTIFRQVEQTVKRDFLPFAGGRKKGFEQKVLHPLMEAASWVYREAVLFRNRLYESGLLRRQRLPLPSVSVGNITVGGTGKTPFVEYTVGLLKRFGRRPAVLARGYGPAVAYRNGPVNDEGVLLSRNLREVPVLLSPDRLSAAYKASELGADCAVLDDAFQHLRVHRDLDVVLIDATVPLGFGRVLPRGLLREPMRGLARADVVVINRADLARMSDLAVLESVIARAAPGVPVLKARQSPATLTLIADGSRDTARILEEIDIGTFCGLGNPYPFGLTLRLLGANVVYSRRFPDHHLYEADEIERTVSAARKAGARMVVVTQKDAVKIDPALAATLALPVYFLSIDAGLTDDEDIYIGLLVEALEKTDENETDASR